MKEITFEDLTAIELSESEQILVNLIRTRYPHLDVRSGTALRDLLVTPDAAIHALFKSQAEEQRAVTSLQTLLERSAAGETVDTEDINRIMSNFNLGGTAGTSAKGTVRVVVSTPRTYVLRSGFTFETLTGLTYTVDNEITATEQPVGNEVKLFKGTANYYFLVPVTCTEVGSAGNITKGTVLSATTNMAGFVSAVSYSDFSGGADMEDIDSVKARIPVALSNRGLLTETSVESVLRDRFDESNNPIVAVSVVGYGNPAQLRDRHNPFGVGVGGRVDVYVRNFTAPYVKTERVVFSKEKEGVYSASISAPGMYNVTGVSDPESETISSYSFYVDKPESYTLPDYHDFDVSKDGTELAGTVWRECTVKLENISEDEEDTKEFDVSMICLPNAEEIQNYFDDPTVRNVGSDYVVRCPAVCRVSVNATCRYEYGLTFDVDAAKTAIANYINTTGFIGRLTRSEVACVLKSIGARSVDINDNYMLTGYVVDAGGTTHRLSGDSLDISDIQDPAHMLTKDTCVFSTAIDNINITAVPA